MYPSMQLGGEKEMIEQAQVGALQIARISVGAMGPVVDELNVFNLPFVFRDETHMRKVIDGPIGTDLLDKISDNPNSRLIALCWMDAGTRNVYSNKPVTKPADLKGMKVRMMGNPIFVETMNAMGGNGVAMGFNELYSALQTGVVDGAENNEPTDARAEPLPGGEDHQPDRPPDHPRDPGVLEAHLGSAVEGRPGAGEASSGARRSSRSARSGTTRPSKATDELKAKGVTFVKADKAAFYQATASDTHQVRRQVRGPAQEDRRNEVAP